MRHDVAERACIGAKSPGRRPVPRIGISACLLGERVRYDGGHKRDAFIADTLSRCVALVPVCPEVEIGLGAPREPMQLSARGREVRLQTVAGGRDCTDAMLAYTEERLTELTDEELCGYILKQDSPSCGRKSIPIYDSNGRSTASGRGIFAEAILHRFPYLPIEDERSLSNTGVRESFVRRVFAQERWQRLLKRGALRARLFQFHLQHEYLLRAHDPAAAERLAGLLRAGRRRRTAEEHDSVLAQTYLEGFHGALQRSPTRQTHGDVLMQLAFSASERITSAERAVLDETILAYRRGRQPLEAPLTILNEVSDAHGITALREQVYLKPHPYETLLLRVR